MVIIGLYFPSPVSKQRKSFPIKSTRTIPQLVVIERRHYGKEDRYTKIRQKVQNRFVKGGVNLVFSNREVHPSSLFENPMDLIRIRNNTIYLDFTYTCPNTATQKRHRKSTRLSDSLQNRILAQQQALTEFSALSQLHIPTQQSQSINHSLFSTVVPSNANSVVVRMNVGDFVEYYKSRRKFRSCSKKTKTIV